MQHNPKINRKIWIIGASEGIGLELVKQLLQQGHSIVASSRNAESNTELSRVKKSYTEQLQLLNCDVTQTKTLPAVCEQACSVFGGLNSWVYNVGTYHPMPLKDWDLDKFEQMNQTNYLAAIHLMHALLPHFKQTEKAQWIWNISLASDFGLPYGGGYSAPKAALMNLAESLQPELREYGVQLKVINHGFVKTRLTAKNKFTMLGLMEPQQAAAKIIQALEKDQFELRFPFNLAWILGTLKRLPKSWALAITKRMLTNDK